MADALEGLALIDEEDCVTERRAVSGLRDQVRAELEHCLGVLSKDGFPKVESVRAKLRARAELATEARAVRQEVVESRADFFAQVPPFFAA